VKNKNLMINLSLFEISDPIGILSLLLFGHQCSSFNASYSPMSAANPNACDRLRLALGLAQNPTANHCTGKFVPIRVCRRRTNLKNEEEYRHFEARDVG
jgi:hypothetical protein